MSCRYISSLRRAEDHPQSLSLRTPSSAGKVIEDDAATVTVKFFINAEEMFTKAFRKSDTIADIKIQLASLFSVDCARIQLNKGEQTLNNDFRLAGLGVEALGTIDLTVSTDSPLVLNRDLIYGHIPTVDVINVRGRDGFQHVVEIEYQQLEKEWLGGYRHTLTKKEYHHASTQTPCGPTQLLKVSKSVQVHVGNEKSTSTPINKLVQTTILPSSQDKWLIPRAPSSTNSNEIEIPEVSPAKEPELCTKKLLQEIVRWNRVENEKLANLDEPQRRGRRFEILDLTRKLLMRADRQRMKRYRALHSHTIRGILSQVGTPKIIVSKTGDRVSVDSVQAQQARRLERLYYDYRRETEIEAKMKVVQRLQDFFFKAEYEFSADVWRLLQTELNLLAKGLVGTTNLETRIEQFILFVFKRLAGERILAREQRCLKSLDLAPYRNILIRLQDDEVKVFKCVSSVCFRMHVVHMYHLVHEIWADCSIKSECLDLNTLRMTRWQKEDEWNVSNCLLLTKYEVKEHLKAQITDYEPCFVSKVKNNHFRAQLLFCGDSTFDKDIKS